MNDGFYYVGNRKLYHSYFDLNWIDEYFKTSDKVKVIFEFGSFDCGDGYRFKQKCKNAEVYSIEACPERYKIIENFAKENKINVYNYAVSNKDGEEIDFYQCLDPNEGDLKYGPAGSILERTWRHTSSWTHLSYPPPIKVKTISLDFFCKTNKINNIDIIHMDVEGAEHMVLKGLTFCNPKMIFLEKHLGHDYYTGGYVSEDMHKYMLDRGYECKIELGSDTLYILKEG